MNAASRGWLRTAVFAGLGYLVIGRVFAWPTEHVRVWRFAAWAVSGVVFAAHLGYELYRCRSAPRSAAFHVAIGVAIGGFGLAVAGLVHALSAASGARSSAWLLALVLFPAVTAVPAFVAALVASMALARLRR